MVWAPDYLTTDELKDYVRVGDSTDNVELGLAIAAASRAVDNHCHRQFGLTATAEERTYTPVWDRHLGRWLVDVDDFQTAVGFEIEQDGVALTGYTSEPVNAPQKGQPWVRLTFPTGSLTTATDVQVTAQWGWTAVPTPVKLATALQAHRFASRRNSPFGVAGSPDVGSELRLLARLDVDVSVALGPFVRRWGAR
jgi:hypothetical protein